MLQSKITAVVPSIFGKLYQDRLATRGGNFSEARTKYLLLEILRLFADARAHLPQKPPGLLLALVAD